MWLRVVGSLEVRILVHFEALEGRWKIFGHLFGVRQLKVTKNYTKRHQNEGSEGLLGTTLDHVEVHLGALWVHSGLLGYHFE